MYDRLWTVRIGVLGDYHAEGNFKSLGEAMNWLRDKVIELYPESQFAKAVAPAPAHVKSGPNCVAVSPLPRHGGYAVPPGAFGNRPSIDAVWRCGRPVWKAPKPQTRSAKRRNNAAGWLEPSSIRTIPSLPIFLR